MPFEIIIGVGRSVGLYDRSMVEVAESNALTSRAAWHKTHMVQHHEQMQSFPNDPSIPLVARICSLVLAVL